MNNEKIKPTRITVRMLESYFSGIQILLDYMNALDNKTSKAVMKKFKEEVAIEGQTLDQSEAVFGFLAYILRNNGVLNQVDEDKRKADLARMAMQFVRLNGLSAPEPGYPQRMHMPEDVNVSMIIKPNSKIN